MAIELNGANWNSEGYRADVLGMLSGETQKGAILWRTYDVFGSDFFKAKIGEIEVTVTPIDFSEENKSVKLRGNNGETLIKIDADNTKDFNWRIKEIENAITSQLFKPGYFGMFKATRDHQPEEERRKAPKPLKLYPNENKGENVPAISKPQEEVQAIKFYPNDHKGTNIPALKKAPERPVPHMRRDRNEAADFKRDVAHGIEKLAKRIGKKKHCKITIKKIVVEVWSDPVIK